jgi:hypothetical protein
MLPPCRNLYRGLCPSIGRPRPARRPEFCAFQHHIEVQQLFQTFAVAKQASVSYSLRRAYRSGKDLAVGHLAIFERIDAVNCSHSFGLLRKASVEIQVEIGAIFKAYKFQVH